WKQRPMHTVAQGDRARNLLVNAHIRNHVNDLLARRNFWLHNTQQRQTYEGVQSSWYSRDTVLRVAENFQDLYAIHAMVRAPEWVVNACHTEFGNRRSVMSTHGAGSYEIDKLITARRIGLSRTKEEAAPTH